MFAGDEMVGHREHGQRVNTFERGDCIQRCTFHLDTQHAIRSVAVLSVVVGFVKHVAGKHLASYERYVMGLGRGRRCRQQRSGTHDWAGRADHGWQIAIGYRRLGRNDLAKS